MKIKTIFTYLILSTLLLSACNSLKTSGDTKQETNTNQSMEKEIPFIEAKNYFVKNTYKEGAIAVRTFFTQAEFEEAFGMATTMGENGKPTPINFSKQYTIALIGQTTDKATSLSVNSLAKAAGLILLTYSTIEGEKQSYTTRPMVLLIVDNQFKGEVKLQKK